MLRRAQYREPQAQSVASPEEVQPPGAAIGNTAGTAYVCAHVLGCWHGARGLGVKGGAAGLIGVGIELGVKGGAAGLIGRVGIELGVKDGAAGLIFGAIVLVGAGLGGMGGSVGGSSIGSDG